LQCQAVTWFQAIWRGGGTAWRVQWKRAEDTMSYVNLPPEATFAKLERVIRHQRRLMIVNAGMMTLFVSGLVASLAALL
jgi:hypothetical protein